MVPPRPAASSCSDFCQVQGSTFLPHLSLKSSPDSLLAPDAQLHHLLLLPLVGVFGVKWKLGPGGGRRTLEEWSPGEGRDLSLSRACSILPRVERASYWGVASEIYSGTVARPAT